MGSEMCIRDRGDDAHRVQVVTDGIPLVLRREVVLFLCQIATADPLYRQPVDNCADFLPPLVLESEGALLMAAQHLYKAPESLENRCLKAHQVSVEPDASNDRRGAGTQRVNHKQAQGKAEKCHPPEGQSSHLFCRYTNRTPKPVPHLPQYLFVFLCRRFFH